MSARKPGFIRAGFEDAVEPPTRRALIDLGRLVRDRMRWLGTWNSRLSYDTGDVVSDDGWTMVCADENGCTERPSPQPIGDPFYLYDGTDPTVSGTLKSVTFGNRYTFPVGGYTTGWRVFTVAGNAYQTYLVKDPLGVAEVSELLSFTGTGGWQEFSLSPVIVEAGATFDLLAIVQEPDATPTTITGDWDYVTPQNPAAPAVGQIVHANSSLAVLSVSKTDQTGAVDLSGIEGGDIIRGPNVSWAVQSVTDQGTWIDFGVSPATQDSPDGVYEFTFETVTATPITYLEDGNYWATSPYAGSVVGLSNVNGNPPLEQGGTAYGTDLQVQSATISDEWEVVSAAGAASGGSGDSTTPQIVYDESNPSRPSSGSDTGRLTIQRHGYTAMMHIVTFGLANESISNGQEIYVGLPLDLLPYTPGTSMRFLLGNSGPVSGSASSGLLVRFGVGTEDSSTMSIYASATLSNVDGFQGQVTWLTDGS